MADDVCSVCARPEHEHGEFCRSMEPRDGVGRIVNVTRGDGSVTVDYVCPVTVTLDFGGDDG